MEEKLDQLQALLKAKAESKAAKKPDFTENYSLGRNKLQNQDKKHEQATRRKPQYANVIVPPCLSMSIPMVWIARSAFCIDCSMRGESPDGKAVYVRYDIHDLPDSTRLAVARRNTK
ncbi:MAG: hypothetical protein IPH10_10755 [bacterium]|nr:hypothetical protein [bacterium]